MVTEVPTATHWGRYMIRGDVDGGIQVLDHPKDPNPSAIGRNFVTALNHPARIARPAIRAGWLKYGPRLGQNRRGEEDFVEIPWDEALDIAAMEIDRIRREHGNQAIYAGSYGWASAGRFHHAQSQVHRFLNMAGGYVRSVNAYSYAAAEVILPRIVASLRQVTVDSTSWATIAEHTELAVLFGGWPLKNAQVNSGGIGTHTTRDWMAKAARRGMRTVLITPMRDDATEELGAEWIAIRPNTDTALMLALAQVLIAEGRADRDFLARYTVGFDRLEAYVLGRADGIVKDPGWAAAITGIPASRIADLARQMAASRTLVSLSWSLQRADHGEQPYWAGVALAAMLGGIGRPGEGFACGLSAMHGVGNPNTQMSFASLSQAVNPVASFIPVARVTEMLENPGGRFTYDGRELTYPDIRLVYWAGGNPFHHHQDLNRLARAWNRPETVIVNEIWWNPLARRADIVFPATTVLERNDIAASAMDGWIMAMHQAVKPVGEARNDHDVFAGMAERLGFADRFREGRNEMEWLRHFYDVARQRVARSGQEWPDFERFWREGEIELPSQTEQRTLLADFRADPAAHPLQTPSGRIELFSERIAALNLPDCPGHPAWIEPREWLGADAATRHPLHLLSNQPTTRLHSQMDLGRTSTDSKIQGREPMRIHPVDAEARGIRDGMVVRLFNDRGACLAGAILDDRLMPGVVQLATGAWWDPDPTLDGLDRHGNPNVLTYDAGTSGLGQGPSAHSCLVEVEPWQGPIPPVAAFDPPRFLRRDAI